MTAGATLHGCAKRCDAERRIKVNQADARVHTVPEGVLLASPAVFKDYVRAHGGAWEHVQNRFLKLKLHQRAPDDTNIFHYGVKRPSGNPDKKTVEIKGIVIADSAVVFAAAAPPANPVLRRIGIGQGNPALKSPAAGDDEQMDKTKHEEIARRVVKLLAEIKRPNAELRGGEAVPPE
jgi:hypothetical protein